LKAGLGVETAFEKLRSLVRALDDDRAMYGEIARVATAIREGEFESELEKL
jgi:histidine ammonia-lyase